LKLKFKALASAFTIIASATLVLSPNLAHALPESELLVQAQKSYSLRDYNATGVQRAQDAAELYGKISEQAADPKLKAQYLINEATALYFVGNASNSRSIKIEKHEMGMRVADEALRLLGVTDTNQVSELDLEKLKSLPADVLKLVGDALYERGTHLGQWGMANGKLQSLNRWPELRDTMQLIINLGLKDSHEFGAFRTLGRGYYEIPGLLGGDNKKAEKYLSSAVAGTLVPGGIFSKNGYNNTYYAELLKDIGKEQQARDLLQAFIAADAEKINPSQVVETKHAQSDAVEMLKGF
jgi:hypothetical protein